MVRSLSIVLIILSVPVVAFSIYIVVSVHTKAMSPEQGQVYAQINMVFLTLMILLIYYRQTQVLSNQAQIMDKQTKLLEVDKLPMLIFQKVDSSQDGETQDKNQENNLNSTENQENGILVGKRNLAFKIINVSKYPVKVEYVSFKPEEGYNEIIEKQHKGGKNREPPQAVRLRGIFGSKGRIIPPKQKIKVPDKKNSEADIVVPGILRIKASNVFYPDDFTLEYEYDTSSGRFWLSEKSFKIGFKGRNNMRANTEYFYEFANKFTPYLTIYSAVMTISIALIAFSNRLAEITTLKNWVFVFIGILFGLSGFSTVIGLILHIWSEIKLFKPLRENLVRFFVFLAILLPSVGLILFFLLLFRSCKISLGFFFSYIYYFTFIFYHVHIKHILNQH